MVAALPLIALSSGLGALEGYRKGGGTAALLGAGLGAALPSGLRMAGTALKVFLHRSCSPKRHDGNSWTYGPSRSESKVVLR